MEPIAAKLIPVTPELLFKGRAGDPRMGEGVKLGFPPPGSPPGAVVVGFPDDLGVVANRGRPGAKGGPDSIRRHLYKMVAPSGLDLYDLGNLAVGSDILKNHSDALAICKRVAEAGHHLIALGGGHDYAKPIASAFAGEGFGVLSLDPHLDMRELENGRPHSGTAFRELIDQKRVEPKRILVFGAHPGRNSHENWSYALKKGVALVERPWEGQVSVAFQKAYRKWEARVSAFGLSIDMDCCCDAEGTSAAPVVGFTARELVQMIRVVAPSRKNRYLEIAEVAPSLDSTERSGRIAAELIFTWLEERAATKKLKKAKKL